MSELVERLRDIYANDDHARGCEGRTYSCSCGFDDRTFQTAEEAASEITRLQEALAAAEARIAAAYVSLTNCPHDMGYDLECGPIGCRLDLTSEGGCVCAGVGPALAPPSLLNKEDRNG